MIKVITINFNGLGLVGLFRFASKLFVRSPFRSHINPLDWYNEVNFASRVSSIHRIRFFQVRSNCLSYGHITDALCI